MADETKQKNEGKPLTDKDLEDISGGIVVQRTPTATAVPSDTTSGWVDPDWTDPPNIKN